MHGKKEQKMMEKMDKFDERRQFAGFQSVFFVPSFFEGGLSRQ